MHTGRKLLDVWYKATASYYCTLYVFFHIFTLKAGQTLRLHLVKKKKKKCMSGKFRLNIFLHYKKRSFSINSFFLSLSGRAILPKTKAKQIFDKYSFDTSIFSV